MRLLIVLSIASFLRVCGSDAPPAETTATVDTPPPPSTAPVTVDTPPPPAVAATTGVGVVGHAEVRMVQAGPREVRLYGLREGRRLPATELRVRRARIMTPQGPQVIVLEPRDDYYVAVTPFDLPPQPRFDVEVAYVADPTPPAVVVVDGWAPRATVEVAAWVPGPPSVQVVAPAPPSVHIVAPAPPSVHIVAPAPPSVHIVAPGPPAIGVHAGVRVDTRVVVPAPRGIVAPPRPPSISVGIGVPSPRVVVVGEAHGDDHGHHGRGVGHIIGRGHGHGRH